MIMICFKTCLIKPNNLYGPKVKWSYTDRNPKNNYQIMKGMCFGNVRAKGNLENILQIVIIINIF
jgi:hypothetical protein